MAAAGRFDAAAMDRISPSKQASPVAQNAGQPDLSDALRGCCSHAEISFTNWPSCNPSSFFSALWKPPSIASRNESLTRPQYNCV